LPMLLLPGNHDWYDGLVNFLAIFCREKATAIGNWRTDQRRSYFAAKLTESWWIWGIDIALVHDMDQPQADYFVAIAEGMPQGANIILCSAEPGWYKAESKGESFRTLSYAAWIAENAKDEHGQTKDLKIPLVLSGDSHHYAHYFGGGTHYITSGGGGAFLHGTLELKPKIEAEWLRDRCAVLNLVSCYPTKDESKKLLDGNHHFGKLNAGFTLLLAGLYWVFAFALTSRLHWDTMLIEFCILVGGLLAYSRYQEGLLSRTIVTVAALQGLAHVLVIAGISGLALLLNWLLLYWIGWNWLLWLGYLAIFAFTLGRWLSGKIFGLTLMYTCRYHDMNHNDAFSSMQLDSHRNFLRIRILRDTLTVFPVKLDKVPARNEWRKNPARQTNPTAAVFDTEVAMNPELVEKPIVIQAQHAPTTAEVRTPGELPRR